MSATKTLKISYSVWKQVVQANAGFVPYFHEDDGVTQQGSAYAGTDEYIYVTRIVDDTWADFDASFPVGTRVAVARRDDAVANIIGLSGIPTSARTSTGAMIIAPTFEHTDGVHPQWEGNLYTATAGVDVMSIFDREVTFEEQLREGYYELFDDNSQIGDYIEQSIVDKNDVLGYFALYGYTVGVNVLELKKYIKKEYVNPLTAGQRITFRAGSTTVLYAGLFMRTTYTSVAAGSNPKFKVTTVAYF